MIRVDCIQNSPEWEQVRLGIPTASEFDRIITPTGKRSSQADSYVYRLLAEQMTGKPQNGYVNGHMDRGHELEPEARRFYELQRDCIVEQVGFCMTDDRRAGCSPDGLVVDNGLVEIKCPAPHTHVQYLLSRKVEQEYWPQVQGQLWVTGRKWADVLSYHPEMTPVIVRVERDEAFLRALENELKYFFVLLETKRNALLDSGCIFAEKKVHA